MKFDNARFLLGVLCGAITGARFFGEVLPDGLDQLPPREVLFTVIMTTVNIVYVCKSA